MDNKQFHVREMKMLGEGKVRAVFATLGVIDHDGDIIVSGAIENGAKVRISAFNHSSWDKDLPVGKGTISEVGNELVLDGQFFLDTTHGSDTYKTVKGLEDLTEWSFGYDILKKDFVSDQPSGREVRRLIKLKVFEVSPVLLGAGIGTRTTDIKRAGGTSQEEIRKLFQDFELRQFMRDMDALKTEYFARVDEKNINCLIRYPAMLAQKIAAADLGLKNVALHWFRPETAKEAEYAKTYKVRDWEYLQYQKEREGRLLGAARRNLHEIWIRQDLSLKETVRVVAHEMKHIDQGDLSGFVSPKALNYVDELDAETYAADFLKRHPIEEFKPRPVWPWV